jgi:polyketide biosynthesis enoyl-CoA hydratase PksH
MSYETLIVSFRNSVCTMRMNRPEANNAINARMIEEIGAVLAECESATRTPPVTIVVLEGLPEVFCSGGDFGAISASGADAEPADPEPLYDLWMRMATGPFVTISVVRGRVNAGGVGFVAASDIVLADRSASFGLSELLFGLFPACVLPFLVRRIGLQKAHYLTLMTSPIGAQEALDAGLADALDDSADTLLRKHLLRLQRLGKPAIARYKRYVAGMAGELERCKPGALATNREMFGDPQIRRNISRYVAESKFPWEV